MTTRDKAAGSMVRNGVWDVVGRGVRDVVLDAVWYDARRDATCDAVWDVVERDVWWDVETRAFDLAGVE